MPYRILDWQRQALAAALDLTPWPEAWPAPLRAARDLAALNLAAMAPKQPRLERAVRRDAGRGAPSASLVRETPFVRVLRFSRGGGGGASGRDPVLLLAPHSGYATAVLSPLVASLLPVGDVWVTDWRDARLVPTSAGRLDLAAQVGLAVGLMSAIGRRAHLVGVSQSGPAILAAAAFAAARDPSLRPASLTLLGSLVDVRRTASPRPSLGLLAAFPRELAAGRLTATVPPGHPGAGRQVFPGLLMLAALAAASPDAYLGIQLGLLLDLLHGSDSGFARAHGDVHDLVDVPAELFLDMLDWAVYRPADRDDGRLTLPGGAITADLSVLAGVPLLTAESGEDELVGPGQTHAAGAVIGTRSGRHVRLHLAGGRHPDLFTGPRFLGVLAPALRRFLAQAGSR